MSESPESATEAVTPPTEASGADPSATEPTGATELAAIVESLLFLSQDPVKVGDLAEATDSDAAEIEEALAELQKRRGGIVLREIGGGWTLASIPEAERAARRLLAKPRTPPLTQAQAECLSIVAYLQPVSRPEIARIRGVASESAVATLEERGLIEDCGRSQFGAILYRTTPLFQRLFGLASMDALPDPSAFDPSPEEEGELRDRLLRAGEVRAGEPAAQGQEALPAPAITAAANPADADEGAADAADPAEATAAAEDEPASAESFSSDSEAANAAARNADAVAANAAVADADAAEHEPASAESFSSDSEAANAAARNADAVAPDAAGPDADAAAPDAVAPDAAAPDAPEPAPDPPEAAPDVPVREPDRAG